ncbi:MAG: fibronectin type III domain-containing protein [Spirochaetota bacterium]
MFNKIAGISIAAFLLIVLVGCQYTSEPQQVLVTSDTLTLAWGAPDFDARTLIDPIEYYRIYYRESGAGTWQEIAQLPGDEKPEYTLYHEDFGDGRYEFAVDYITVNGQASGMHTSRDHTADPMGGWYVLWMAH